MLKNRDGIILFSLLSNDMHHGPCLDQKKVLDFDNIVFLFLFNKYYLIMK